MIQESNMKEVEKIMKKLKENKPILREKYKVKTLGVFGSYIREERLRKDGIEVCNI